MKILLVEDDIKLGKATKELLTYENCFVDWAEDGIEALSVIRNNTNECYDAIFHFPLSFSQRISLPRTPT